MVVCCSESRIVERFWVGDGDMGAGAFGFCCGELSERVGNWFIVEDCEVRMRLEEEG